MIPVNKPPHYTLSTEQGIGLTFGFGAKPGIPAQGMHVIQISQIPLVACITTQLASTHLVQACVGDLGKVMMLIVIAHIVCEGIQGAIVAVGLLPLQQFKQNVKSSQAKRST